MKTCFILIFVFITLKTLGQGNHSLENCAKIRDKESLANLYDVEKKNKEIDYMGNWEKCVIGKKIPDFEVKTIDNELISSKDLNGKIVVINFWATWCKPCMAEVPALNLLVEKYKGKEVVFLAFTEEVLEDNFLKNRNFNFKLIQNNESVFTLFGVQPIPTTFIIDKTQTIVKVAMGGATDERAKRQAYEQLNPIIAGLLK